MHVPHSGRTLADVQVDLTVQCIDDQGTQHDIDTVLGYTATDPYAATMTFLTDEGDLVWTFARDLLAVGTHGPVGDGDVHVAPSLSADGRATVDIALTSPDGRLVLHARSDEVADFVTRAFDSVPAGTEAEHLDIDAMIYRIVSA